MSFKFNPCNPCCSTCRADYVAYICPPTPLASSLFPDYMGINPGSIVSYLALCTGVKYDFFNGCSCYGYGPPVSEYFYPLLNPSTGHTFFYTPNSFADHYVIVTKSFDNDIYPQVSLLTTDPFNTCVPACSGSIAHILVPTGWYIGFPCWFSKDFANKPISYHYDISQTRAKSLGLLNGLPQWCCDNIFDITGNAAAIYYCDATSGILICNPVGSVDYFDYNQGVFDFTMNVYRDGSMGGVIGWISDLQLEYTWIRFFPSGFLCGLVHATSDIAEARWLYIAGLNPIGSCKNITAVIDYLIAPSALPYPSPVAPFSTFTGPTALSDARSFLNSLPRVIAATGNYGIFNFGQADVFVQVSRYNCTSNVDMLNPFFAQQFNCLPAVTGNSLLTVSQ